MHIVKLLQGVLHKLNTIITGFIWAGTQQTRKFHLVSLDIINCSIKQGGWGSYWRLIPSTWHMEADYKDQISSKQRFH